MNTLKTLAKKYTDAFRQSYIMVKAPGRINIIGEHTDYNEGWVLPAAIDKHIYFALGISAEKDYIEIYSPHFDEKARFSVQATAFEDIPTWSKYLQAATIEMQARGYAIRGINGAMDGNIPLGAGLSSSAALCCGFIYGLAQLNEIDISKAEIALIAQATEHRVGLNCGLMDQYAVLFGEKDKVIGLDCQSLDFEHFPLALKEYSIVLFNSNIKHELAADSGYNDRRASCERVVQTIQQEQPEVTSLRAVDHQMLESFQKSIKPIDYKRARYILQENERVVKTMQTLKEGKVEAIGKYLYQSHHGMRHEYEITVPEIDLLVDYTKEIDAVIGSRMMGGGFGGCTINFIHQEEKEAIIKHAIEFYQSKTGKELSTYEVEIEKGVHLI